MWQVGWFTYDRSVTSGAGGGGAGGGGSWWVTLTWCGEAGMLAAGWLVSAGV